MQKKTSILVANGHIEDLAKLSFLFEGCHRIVAVDRGLVYCKQLGLTPDLIVGDFDSVPPHLLDEYAAIHKITLPKEKNETDLEVALEHEIKLSQTVILLGAWGGRIDHSLTNLLLASRYPGRVRLETEQETVFAIQGSLKIKASVGQTISLLPIQGSATGITTKGLQWELNDGALDASFIGISNVCLQKEISISIRQGLLLCSLIKAALP